MPCRVVLIARINFNGSKCINALCMYVFNGMAPSVCHFPSYHEMTL